MIQLAKIFNFCANRFVVKFKLMFHYAHYMNTYTVFTINLVHYFCFFINIFGCFDSLHPSQQLFSHVGMGLPGLDQY